MKRFFTPMYLLWLAGLVCAGLLVHPSPTVASSTSTGNALVRGLPDFTGLVEKAGPAVVGIRTLQKVSRAQGGFPGMPPGLDENDPFYEFFRRFFPPGHPGMPQQGQPGESEETPSVPRGVGSGFIISTDGFILSNHHVVEGADEVFVSMTDGREFKAKIVGSDQRTDVALLKIEAKNLPALPLGDPSKLKVGAWVVAIGSPFGLENTVTAGIVSAKGRDTGDYLPFIQTDVAVNPGNSGGPLLNLDGEVIGINSQIYSRTGGFMGISFAIPIDEANSVAQQLKASGRVVRGRIGVAIGEVTREVAEALGLKTASGALVRSVDPEGPARKAGIEPGDIVLSFAGNKVVRMSDLPRLVGKTQPGRTESIEVWRRGEKLRLTVSVAELVAEPQAQAAAPKPPEKAVVNNWLGLGLSDLTDEDRNRLNLKAGVAISNVSGPSERSGIRQGDIILSVNNTQVESANRLAAYLDKLDKRKPVVFLVRRGDGVLFIPVRP
ncbi:MAG: DegQ family serine endoprotease [Burkholderiaceae bacterium]